MKINKIITSIFFILFLILAGCQEPYDPQLSYKEIKIPSIEALLTDEPGENYIKISWLAEFEKGYNTPVTEANVNIMDDNGNNYHYFHDKNGTYKPNNPTFSGESGVSYKLEITLNSGEIYESPFIEMRRAARVDTMYAKIGKTDVVSTNVNGETQIEEKDGLQVNYDVISTASSRQYFVLSSKVLYQHNYHVYIPPSTTIIVYLFRGEYSYKAPKAEMSVLKDGNQVSLNQEADFLIYEWDYSTRGSENGRSKDAAYPVGWIVKVTCQVVNEETYSFYQNLSRQIASEDQIFDPVPYQINGNIKCISDTSKIALGNFDVGPVITETYGFHWTTGSENIIAKRIENREFPMVKGNTSESPPQAPMPAFWFDYTASD